METSDTALATDQDRRYKESFDELMNGHNEDANGIKVEGDLDDDDDGDDDDDDDNGGPNGVSTGSRIGNDVLSYSDRLKEIIGSDEEGEEDMREGSFNREEEGDDELVPNSGGTPGDESLRTELGPDESRVSLASTSSSMFPSSALDRSLLRPWQYPKPKRLRSLANPASANATDDASLLSPSLSFQNAGHSGSNSIVDEARFSPRVPGSTQANEDGSISSIIDGLSSTQMMMPYGIPEKPPLDEATGNGKSAARRTDSIQRSILRLAKVAKIELSQRGEERVLVMAVAGGLIAAGTSQARVGLWEFSGRFKGWLALPPAPRVDAAWEPDTDQISALSISSDRTFVAIGTSQGHIYLYDVAKPRYPARHVAPTTPKVVATGRNEGHLQGSKILHVGFVGARHTAVVSADEYGLSFYHSLGKILGVSSNDTLRLLGRYPSKAEREAPQAEGGELSNGTGVLPRETAPVRYRQTTALGMAPLPLGPTPHLSDEHGIVAILTPTKLVIVGLKPAARTWFRRLPPSNTIETCGSLTWYPSIKATEQSSATETDARVQPILAANFGRFLVLVRLKALRLRNGSAQPPSIREELTMEEEPGWEHDEPIRSLQWLSHELLLLQSDSKLALFDLRYRKVTETQPALSLASSLVANDWLSGVALIDSKQGTEKHLLPFVNYSMRAYKGQVFILTPHDILVGTLVTWADRILAHVSGGDFLGAIELSTDYLEGRVGGSCIGLPESREAQRPIVAQRLVDLMRASTAYAFSDERMHDGTHADPRGVDRTPLFEGLARVCAEACLALHDQSFLFDELYDTYADAGIESIFADQMEHFIVSGQLKRLPIPVVQRLITFRKRQERYDLAERIIWNVDPTSLDLDQALSLCLERRLFDALIYVYTRALHDYVGPIVELLGIVKRRDALEPQDNVADCYRLFSYLSVALTGHTYPNHDPLQAEEGLQARTSIYGFLFAGRCVMWPEGPGGQLVLTVADDRQEPTYPYLRLLLAFDAEAFLDALDLAFEDSFLDHDEDDVSGGENGLSATSKQAPRFTRQLLISILSEVTFESESELDEYARMFVCIFVARNAPKYPQFVRLSSADVEKLLRRLALIEDAETLEDRQFAAECLLSAYHLTHSDELLADFERGKFTRILHRAYRAESKWDRLAELVIAEAASNGQETFDELARLVSSARKGTGKGKGRKKGQSATQLSSSSSQMLQNVERIVLQSLPILVDVDVDQAAEFMARFFPDRQAEAITLLDRSPHRQLAYLSVLLDPWHSGDDSLPSVATHGQSSKQGQLRDSIDQPQKDLYITLLSSLEPHMLVRTLDAMPRGYFDLKHVVKIADEEGVIDGVLWAFDRQGQLDQGLDAFEQSVAQRVFVLREQSQEEESRLSALDDEAGADFEEAKQQLEKGVEMAVRLCREHGLQGDAKAPEHWVRLLKILIRLVHDVTNTGDVKEGAATRSQALAKSFVEDSLSALVSSTTADSMPFASLFRRLLEEEESGADGESAKSSRYYAEVRPILNGTVEAYRLRQELLGITNRLFDRDVFTEMQKLNIRRRRGWRPGAVGAGTRCEGCQRSAFDFGVSSSSNSASRTRSRGNKQRSPNVRGRNSRSSALSVSSNGTTMAFNGRLSNGGDGSIVIPSLDDLPKRTPSPFLEPTVSPRPDKGKGVERRPSALSLGHDTALGLQQQQQQQQQEPDLSDAEAESRYQDNLGDSSINSAGSGSAVRMRRRPTTDPSESFTAPVTPRSSAQHPSATDWYSLTRPSSDDYFGSATGTPRMNTRGSSGSLVSSFDGDMSLEGSGGGKGGARESDDGEESSEEGVEEDGQEDKDTRGQVVVLVNGQVWHRRCAPSWVLDGRQGPDQAT